MYCFPAITSDDGPNDEKMMGMWAWIMPPMGPAVDIMIMGGMNIQLVPTIGSDAPIYNFQLGMIATFMESMCSRWPCHFHAGDGEVCVSSPNLRLQETARRRDGRCPQGAARWCQNGMYKGTFYQFIIPESYNYVS